MPVFDHADFTGAGGAPAAYLDLLDAVAFRTAAAGSRLGVFTALDAGAATPGEVAAATGTDPLGVRILLDALAGYGYTERDGGRYRNSANTTRWLLPGPDSFAPVLSFWSEVLSHRWDDLEESIRRGGPAGDFYAWLEQRPDTLAEFQLMLRRLADQLGPEIVALAAPSGAALSRAGGAGLLDLGGGHAAYTAAFLQAYPGLRGTVVDLPGALRQGARTVAEAGLGDRVTLRAGDLFTAELGAGYDLVLLANIVHGYQHDDVLTLLGRAAGALRPGGRITLLEPLAEVPQRGPGPGEAFVRMFSLNLFHTQGGRAYGLDELTALLGEAGFTGVTGHRLSGSDTDHVVTAVHPG